MKTFDIEPFNDYDYESIILNFWMHSVTIRMKEFDFETAFECIKNPIERKLNKHGLLGYDSFYEYQDEFISSYYGDNVYAPFVLLTNYINISEDDVKDAILNMQYNKLKETFEVYDSFKTLKNLLVRIENSRYTDLEKKTILFDEIIHAQHETGKIFDDLNIEDLREQAEEEIKELLELA